MAGFIRRSTPKVVDGRVQKKNRHAPTENYWNTSQPLPVVDKERPGRGYKHLLSKADIHEFIEIIPEWNLLADGLDAVLLAAGDDGCDGWYNYLGIIALCAWERDLWKLGHKSYYVEHQSLFQRLGIPCERRGQDYLCKFTVGTARAYQLLHVFLHELGHHNDLMTSRSQNQCGRGVSYAEDWAFKYEAIVWDRYLEKFGLS